MEELRFPFSIIPFPSSTAVAGLLTDPPAVGRKEEINMALFMEPFWILMDKIADAARKEDQMRQDPRYVQCLNCRGFVLKGEVRKRGGCYLCGWKPGAKGPPEPRGLKVKCPQCGRTVLKSELIKRGCYLCGWKG